jgi:two-component system, chemotaxis family, response regulator WspR
MNALAPMAGSAMPSIHSRRPIMVLLVDDQLFVGEAVRRALLAEQDVEFHFCTDCANAVEVARKLRPTVILQDLVMPGINGLDLVAAYRTDRLTADIPIIVLSTKEEATVKRDAFRLGANDYLVKLPDPVELTARIRYHSKAYMAQLQRDDAYRALRQSQQELMESNLELKRLTNVDGLTGLSNRRYLNEYLEAEWSHAMRVRAPFSLMMIDIDHFKLYNDHYGHLAGDEVLQQVAAVVKAACARSSDVAARFGGEEFVVVLPSLTFARLQPHCDTVVRKVEALRLPHAGSNASEWVTISVGGVTATPARGQAYSTVIDLADQALYQAKRCGRNRAITQLK